MLDLGRLVLVVVVVVVVVVVPVPALVSVVVVVAHRPTSPPGTISHPIGWNRDGEGSHSRLGLFSEVRRIGVWGMEVTRAY